MKRISTLLLVITMAFMISVQDGNAQTTKTVGNTGANYSTLKLAFDAINAGAITGAITLQVIANTTETATAKLNQSGTGSANYTSVNINPIVSGLTITGNLALPLIDLSGADYVTIDGRVNATGSAISLTISNTSTSATAGTSTIRFINDASSNVIKYCTIKGSTTAAASGIIFFSTTSGTTGNDGNTISNNNITNSADASRPLNAIYSSGTAAYTNSVNVISNNNIYDFLNRATASFGININANNTTWTITGNSFYETTAFAATGAVAFNVLQIISTGTGFTVSGNYIGGKAALCGGAAWTKTGQNTAFTGINLSVGTGTASNVQNNTIQNISWTNTGSATWMGIDIEAGDVNVGTIGGNIVGSAAGTGSVIVTAAATAAVVDGIDITSTGIVVIQNNIIGSITAANTSTLASNFYGINKTAVAGTTTISNNTIGSKTTANSISASSASTTSSNAQSVYGIYSGGTGTVNITGNTIANLTNGTTNTTTGTAGVINGITSVNGTNSVTNNTIYNLSIANANTSATNTASVCGIALSAATLRTVTLNTIYNLSNSYASFAGYLFGIYFTGGTGVNSLNGNLIYNLSVTGASSGAANVIGLNFNAGTGANVVSGNFIYSLSVTGSSTSASLYGIRIVTGVASYSNNITSLGGNTSTTVFGIYDAGTASQTCYLYFNTVYIGGSQASGANNKSYCLYSNASSNTRDYRNNIFVNARSTVSGTSKHYAVYFNYAVSTNLTLGYNDYFISGTGGVLGYYNSADKTTLPIITGLDVSSLAINPVFATPGGTTAVSYYPSASLPGVSITGINTDYSGTTRGSPPKMGALESSNYVWQGTNSTNYADPDNWTGSAVPPDGSIIAFASAPSNHCFMDQNRSLSNIINAQAAKDFVTNGYQLTITGSLAFTNGAQIDATAASSVVVFAGSGSQNIPSGAFLNNSVQALTISNSSGVTLNGDLSVEQTLTLAGGAFSVGANNLTINGAISTTSGTLLGGSSSNIVVGGSGTVTTLPAVSLNNLTLNRANGLNLGGPVGVAGILLVSNGTLTTGGYLTLLSSASQTALIDGSGAGQVSGNVTVQRYIVTAYGYNYYSIPFQSGTVGQFSGFVNLSATFPAFYRYDENQQSNGWISYTSSSNSLAPMQGYAANLGNSGSAVTVSLTGAVNNGTQTAPTLYNHNYPYTLGFNLVGNPYPSPINWTAGSGWTKTNIDNAIYYFDSSDTNQYYGTYSSYVNGVSSNGIANNIIPAMQGFFIHVSNGTYPVAGTLVFNNSVRINNLNPVFHKPEEGDTQPLVRLSAGFSNQKSMQDHVVVYFENTASPAFDNNLDALKLMNTSDLVPNLYAVSTDAERLSISAIPSPHDSITEIPLGLDLAHDGQISFNSSDMELIPAEFYIYLLDRHTGIYHDMRASPEFSIYLLSGSYGNRFLLVFSRKVLTDIPVPVSGFSVYSFGGMLTVDLNLSSDTGGDIIIYDLLGRSLFQRNLRRNGTYKIDVGFSSGVYIVRLSSDSGVQSKKVYISML
ncbi:MAG: T9SS type A sorting domain-containing protein [Bacteroidota bacterium]|jgi:hypothetical protein